VSDDLHVIIINIGNAGECKKFRLKIKIGQSIDVVICNQYTYRYYTINMTSYCSKIVIVILATLAYIVILFLLYYINSL